MNMKNKYFIIFLSISIIFLLFIYFSWYNKPQTINTPSQIIPTPTIFITTPSPTPFIREGGGLLNDKDLQTEKEFVEKTPVLQRLPGGDGVFSISYLNEQHLIVYNKLSNKEFAYQEAKRKLIENGIDISKILIEYK